jgi:four helix bundle protein
VRDFRDLKVWAKAHELTLRVYSVTRAFPRDELYGLTSQVRRAASSIPANLAEGCGREGDAEFARFGQIAFGSANELEYHLLLSKDLGYLSEQDHAELAYLLVEVKRMLSGLLTVVRSNGKSKRTQPKLTADC